MIVMGDLQWTGGNGREGSAGPLRSAEDCGVIRILIVDGPHLLRDGVAALLSRNADHEVLQSADCIAIAERRLASEEVDVVVFQQGHPDTSAVDAVRALRAIREDVPIVVLVTRSDSGPIAELLKMGADACLAVDDSPEALGRAIQAVVKGQSFLSDAATRRVVDELRKRPQTTPEARLTPRQTQVLELLATGMRSSDIAARLEISEKTVHVYRGQLRERLGLRSIAELTSYAIQHGLVARTG